MRKTLFFTLILLFSTTLFAATNLTAADQLSKLLNQFTTLKANFTQETLDVNQRVLARSSGSVAITKPNHFRWETKQPTHQIVIADGNTLWVYDVDLAQATKQTIQNNAINPAKLLSGDTRALLQQFHVRMIPHQKILVFTLTPNNTKQAFHSISIAFAHDKLIAMHIESIQEQTSVFNFSKVELNSPLSPDLFKFKVPTGVDVLQGST